MKKEIIKDYAELLVKVGVNLQKGEKLVVSSPVIAADLTREIAKAAYKSGARDVDVIWNDQELEKIGLKNRTIKSLSVIPDWAKAQRESYIEEKICYIAILSLNPDAMKNVSSKKISVARKAKRIAFRKFSEYTSSNKIRWTIAAYPNKAWAKKVYPDFSSSVALKKLWEAVIACVRLDNPSVVDAWAEHQTNLQRRCEFLNKAKIKRFIYKNSIGTDFSIGMPDNYIFCGGAELGALDGIPFTANLPTEEVFSSPDRLTANGRLASAMPLSSNGKLIDKFWIEFKNGRIIDYGAEKGLDTLKEIIETDDGSHYLGEIALVGFDSPVRKQNVLFFETLFDENASCHFAIGNSYPNCVEGGGDMDDESLLAAGLNVSLEHVDFMVGTRDLSILCETVDGRQFDIFVNGEWVI